MALATENWSSFFFQRGERAFQEWTVTGVDNADQATTCEGVAQILAGFKYDPTLIARHPVVRHKGPNTYIVGVEFGPAPSAQTTGGSVIVTRVEVSTGTETDGVDFDADGNEIVNAAGFPFNPAPTRSWTTRHITIYRNVGTYSNADARAFENHVNSSAITIPGYGTIPEHCMYCESIAPVGIIFPTQLPTQRQIAMSFEERQALTEKELSGEVSPFDHRILNQSLYGWYEVGGNKKMGRFCDTNGADLSQEVPIDISGLPIPSRAEYVKVLNPITKKPETAVAAPSGFPTPVHEITSAGVVFLRPKRYQRADFNALLA